jgi:hypothetical protein
MNTIDDIEDIQDLLYYIEIDDKENAKRSWNNYNSYVRNLIALNKSFNVNNYSIIKDIYEKYKK